MATLLELLRRKLPNESAAANKENFHIRILNFLGQSSTL